MAPLYIGPRVRSSVHGMALARSRLLELFENWSFPCNRLLGKSLWLHSVTACSVALAGCEATPDGVAPLPSDISLESADNYQVTIGLAIPELTIDPAAPTFDWSAVADNLRGEPIAATEITLLTLARFDGEAQTTITQRLESGEGVSSLADAAGKLVPNGTATIASLVDFEHDQRLRRLDSCGRLFHGERYVPAVFRKR